MTVLNPDPAAPSPVHPIPVEEVSEATIRLAGDSGDGMQLAGTQFTHTSAMLGNDISTLPDFPAEIRAPAGTLAGVSGFQIHFSSQRHPHARRPAQHPGRHEPGRPENQSQGPGTGRHPHRQCRRLPAPAICTRPATRPIRSKMARSRAIACSPSRSRQAEPRGRRRAQAQHRAKPTAARTSSPWAWSTGSTSGSLDPTLRWIREQIRQEPGACWRPTRAPSRPATTTARRPRRCPCITASPRPRSRPAAIARSPATKRWPSVWSPPSKQSGLPLVYASYPITPASDILHSSGRIEALRRAHTAGRG